MPTTFAVDFNPESFLSQLKEVAPENWPQILSDASNQTGYYVLNKYQQQMNNYLDRPVPYTLNSMYLQKSTPSTLAASVQWKDSSGGNISAGKYLQPEVFGGSRGQKKFERALQAKGLIPNGFVAVPTDKAPLDSYGNVPGSYFVQILSAIGANPAFVQNKQIKKLRKLSSVNLIKGVAKAALAYKAIQAKEARAKARAQKFFVVVKGDGNPLPIGVYERTSLDVGSIVVRVFNFVPTANYRTSFPFYDIGTAAAQAKFPEKLDEAIQTALGKAIFKAVNS